MPATSTFLPRPRPPPRRSDAPGFGLPQDPHEQEGDHADEEAARGGGDGRGKRDLHAALDRPGLGENRERAHLAVLLGVRKGGVLRHGGQCTARLRAGPSPALAPRQRVRSYTRYFFTISPPIASMARFMALFVSRIQPISPPFTRVASAMSKCSAYRPAATPVCW